MPEVSPESIDPFDLKCDEIGVAMQSGIPSELSELQKPIVRGEQGWYDVIDYQDQRRYCLRAINHPRLGSQWVTTSPVVWETDNHPEFRIVETRNTFYFLEK